MSILKEIKTTERLKKGNKKLHEVLVFDILAGESCLNCEGCGCYKKGRHKVWCKVFVNTKEGEEDG